MPVLMLIVPYVELNRTGIAEIRRYAENRDFSNFLYSIAASLTS